MVSLARSSSPSHFDNHLIASKGLASEDNLQLGGANAWQRLHKPLYIVHVVHMAIEVDVRILRLEDEPLSGAFLREAQTKRPWISTQNRLAYCIREIEHALRYRHNLSARKIYQHPLGCGDAKHTAVSRLDLEIAPGRECLLVASSGA